MAVKDSGQEEKPSEMQKVASSYRSGWAYAEYAFQYGIAVILCTLVGWWVDNQFNTNGLFIIIGVFVGATAGFIGLLKSLKVFSFKRKNKV